MKYWRGYLIAAIFAFFTGALMLFAKTHTVLIDMVYPYITRLVQTFLAVWSADVTFCLWQLFAVLLILWALASIVLMIVLRWNPVQWFGWVLAAASLLFFLHTGIYGLNSYAGSIADDLRLSEVEYYSLSQLEEAAAYYRDQANELAGRIPRNGNAPDYPSFGEMAQQAGEGFVNLVYEDSYSIYAGSTEPVKELGWADMYTSMGITGVTMPLTGEAAVNPQIPAVSLPFTMCHEMAHRMSIANERDANMSAFLACRANSSIEFQYSAYFMAYRYCYNSLLSLGTADAKAAASRVAAGESELLRRDLKDYNSFFSENMDENATETATKANDTYLKISGSEDGVESYGHVTDLLVSWHIQHIVLPNQTEDENKFDPFDENAVFPPETEEGQSNG